MSDKYEILEELVKRLNYKNVNNLSKEIVRESDKGKKMIRKENITAPMLRQARAYLRNTAPRSRARRELTTSGTTSTLRIKPKPKPKPKPVVVKPKPVVVKPKPVIKPPVKVPVKVPVKPKIPVKKK